MGGWPVSSPVDRRSRWGTVTGDQVSRGSDWLDEVIFFRRIDKLHRPFPGLQYSGIRLACKEIPLP